MNILKKNSHTNIMMKLEKIIHLMEVEKMEGNQKIHCTVETCKYNEKNQNLCKLQAIQVEPTKNCDTKKADESMCSNYIYEKK